MFVQNVSFYKNTDHVATIKIPRPLTDCYNEEGILIGDSNMELGQLRFYAKKLSRSDIKEIFQYGMRLSDLSTGSQAPDISESESLSTKQAILSSLQQVQSSVDSGNDRREVSLLSQAVETQSIPAVQPYASPVFPVQTSIADCYKNGSLHSEMDIVTNLQYYSLISKAARLTETTGNDARYLEGIPTFSGTGMTLTFWYRHKPCQVPPCGAYVFHCGQFPPSTVPNPGDYKAYCWALWIEDEAFWVDTFSNPGYLKFSDHGIDSKYKFTGDKHWRHIAFQLDQTTDMIRFYLDGKLAIERPHGGKVSLVIVADTFFVLVLTCLI